MGEPARAHKQKADPKREQIETREYASAARLLNLVPAPPEAEGSY